MMTMAAEEQRNEAAASVPAKEVFYKTKLVQFLGRAKRIVLQNDNGPCPLLAICNVLLLRNSISLSSDLPEVSLQQLLSLVAERLIDSNSNVQDKDDGYVNNQQQNISDAIDLLPRLATGIDVNVQFRKINDFEFTRECAIFDLLDIGLYHGWIVDPQDTVAAAAIGSKSYNTVVAELVQIFEARKYEGSSNEKVEDCVDSAAAVGSHSNEEVEDCVDSAAATTASLGVPSPSLSRDRSSDDQVSVSPEKRRGKGDIEEEEELMQALNLSNVEVSTPGSVSMPADADQSILSVSLGENKPVQISALRTHIDSSGSQNEELSDIFPSQEYHTTTGCKDVSVEECENNLSEDVGMIHENSTESEENVRTGTVINKECESDSCGNYKELMAHDHGQSIMKALSQNVSTYQIHEDYTGGLVTASPCKLQASNGQEPSNVSLGVTPCLQGNEPIYEGVGCIPGSGFRIGMTPRLVYEGEMILTEQAKEIEKKEYPADMDKDAYEQWHVMKCFLEHNSSQLTIYGLFCLQEGLKERELCVFFRNNHFSTMFKFKGELYLLATDQGYMDQPDLVWEKLNEVNGNTVFMTGNFTEFNANNEVHGLWNEQSSMTSTVDYLAGIDSSGHPNSTLDSDLQLAMALHQNELEQVSQRQQQRQRPKQPSAGRSRLVVGPQVPNSRSGAPRRDESNRKEKCVVM